VLIALLAGYFGLKTIPAAWNALNTDFSNYYLTARLAREKADTSRIYEWIWLQRQKDHREIDQRIISLVPITPFSTLVLWPIAFMAPLAAKHYWLVANLAMVIAIACLLKSLTELPWRHVLLVMALSIPLNKNFLYGQFYVLLLFCFTLSYWCYVRNNRFAAGLLIGVGFGLKLFPLLYLGYFLRKKAIRAFTGGIVGAVAAASVSIAAFGWQAHRAFMSQVLPWALRGEGLDPYNLSSASIATLLHRLFIYEPQWNPRPAIDSAWLFAVCLPLAQTLVFAPALLLADPDDNRPKRLHLEWSAVLLASLAISTLPAGYHFTLLILPVCLICRACQERFGRVGVVVLLLLYVAIGYPGWKTIGAMSPWIIFSVPRLYVVISFCMFGYWLLATPERHAKRNRETWIWACILASSLIFNIGSGLQHQRGLYADYSQRLATTESVLQASGPLIRNDGLLFTAMVPAGYRTAEQHEEKVLIDAGGIDQLAITANQAEQWTEETSVESSIVSNLAGREVIHKAESPMASPDGKWLAYLREEHGRNSMWLRALDHPEIGDKQVTDSKWNVLEMSFMPDGSLIFSSELNGGRPGLFFLNRAGVVTSLGPEEARYPAISPNAHWLAFSMLQGGNWHLWLRDLHNGHLERLTDADCNNMAPSWSPDSRTLAYASDCGRALWFTAICRRPIPD
jgi:hypothetical protein